MAVKSPEEKAWITQSAQLAVARKNTATFLDGLVRACGAKKLEHARKLLADLKAQVDRQKAVYARLEKTVDAYVAFILKPKDKPVSTDSSSAVAPSALEHDETAFPSTLTKTMIANGTRAGGGSTGARFITDGGRRYVCKQTSAVTGEGNVSDACLRNEAAGDMMYRAAGILVPDCKVYEVDGKPVKIAEMIEHAVPLSEYFRKATPAKKTEIKRKLMRGYLMDVVLGNWDVVGMGGDNILVDENGDPWRIDNGSSMGFRAQGTPKKPEEWKDAMFPDEWRTMLSSSNNSEYFGDFSPSDIFSQEINWDAVINSAPLSEKPVIERRVREIKEMQARCRGLTRSGVRKDEVDAELNTTYDLVKSGLRDAVPKVKVSSGNPDFGFFRPNSTGGRPVGLSPDDAKMQTIVDKLIAAAKTVNHHAATDGCPNMSTVKDALAAAMDIPVLKKAGIKTEKWEKVVKELKSVKASGQTKKVGVVPDYTPQKKTNAGAVPHGSLTEWKADMIMRGGDPNADAKWENYEFIFRCTKSQGYNSWMGEVDGVPYTCIRKIIEYELVGKNPDPNSGGKNGEVYGFTQEQKDAYRKAWDYYRNPKNKKEMERARRAVSLDRAFTLIEMENAGLPYYDPETQTVLLARTEDDDVIGLSADENGKKPTPGSFASLKTRGNGESCSMFKTVVVEGDNLTIQRVPIALIGDTYLTHRMDKSGGFERKYLGDRENEAHVDLNTVLQFYYAGHVRRGQDLKPYFEKFLAAEKKRNSPR